MDGDASSSTHRLHFGLGHVLPTICWQCTKRRGPWGSSISLLSTKSRQKETNRKVDGWWLMHHAIAPYGQYSAAYCRRPDLMQSWEFQILRMIIENSVCTSAVVFQILILIRVTIVKEKIASEWTLLISQSTDDSCLTNAYLYPRACRAIVIKAIKKIVSTCTNECKNKMPVHFSTSKPDQQAINNSVCYVCRPFGRNQEPCPTRTRQDDKLVCFSARKYQNTVPPSLL